MDNIQGLVSFYAAQGTDLTDWYLYSVFVSWKCNHASLILVNIVQVMAWCLNGTKPLPEPMLTDDQWALIEYIIMVIHFQWKYIWYWIDSYFCRDKDLQMLILHWNLTWWTITAELPAKFERNWWNRNKEILWFIKHNLLEIHHCIYWNGLYVWNVHWDFTEFKFNEIWPE